jgi:LmbE family N-acetylglucosaminyl deacetylase
VIAPHPDDEIFGCAGLISRHIRSGGSASVILLTDGDGSLHSHPEIPSIEVGRQRRRLALSACQSLGLTVDQVTFLGWKDGSLPHPNEGEFEAHAQTLAVALRAIAPRALFVTHPGEGWSDHTAAAHIAARACADLENCTLFYYCVWFWYSVPLRRMLRMDWRRSFILPIREQMATKRSAIECYMNAPSPVGVPWVGQLPAQFLASFDWSYELYFQHEREHKH